MISRPMYTDIWNDLVVEKRMIFLAGPRQVGKTTLSRMISGFYSNHTYLNWDIPAHRTLLIRNPSFFQEMERVDEALPLVILDEIHKYRDWKNYLKGIYDQFHDEFQFLVSGSGRLDLYQKGSDSLAGRYFLFHLWPFTIAELGNLETSLKEFTQNPLRISVERNQELKEIWKGLDELGG